jgi:hypothetical protein
VGLRGTLARFDSASDKPAAKGVASLGMDPSKLLSVIDANEALPRWYGLGAKAMTGRCDPELPPPLMRTVHLSALAYPWPCWAMRVRRV